MTVFLYKVLNVLTTKDEVGMMQSCRGGVMGIADEDLRGRNVQ